MIGAVSGVNFRANDIINQPGKFSQQPAVSDAHPDSFVKEEDKKSGSVVPKVLLTAAALVGSAAVLGYLVKTGKLNKVDIETVEGFFKKSFARVKNAGHYIGEKACSAYEWCLNLIGKGAKQAADV